MKNKKPLMVLSTVLIIGLIIPGTLALPINNSLHKSHNVPNSEPLFFGPIELNKNTVPVNPQNLTLDDINEELSYEEYDKAIEADDIEDPTQPVRKILWIAWTRGVAQQTTPPVTDSYESIRKPMVMRLIVKHLKTTPYGKVYEVLRGYVRIGRDWVRVKGYAVLFSDATFVMKLNGEDFSLTSVGKIAPARWGVWMAMKGYATMDEIEYSFHMKGKAIPLIIRPRVKAAISRNNELKEKVRAKIANRVRPQKVD